MGNVGSSPDKVSRKPVPEAPSGFDFVDSPVQSLAPHVVVGVFIALATCAYCRHPLRWNQYYEFCRCCGHYCHTTTCLNYLKLAHPDEPAEMVRSEYVCGACCKTRYVVHKRCGTRMLFSDAEHHICSMQEIICEICQERVLVKDYAEHQRLRHSGIPVVNAHVVPDQGTPHQPVAAVPCGSTVNPREENSDLIRTHRSDSSFSVASSRPKSWHSNVSSAARDANVSIENLPKIKSQKFPYMWKTQGICEIVNDTDEPLNCHITPKVEQRYSGGGARLSMTGAGFTAPDAYDSVVPCTAESVEPEKTRCIRCRTLLYMTVFSYDNEARRYNAYFVNKLIERGKRLRIRPEDIMRVIASYPEAEYRALFPVVGQR
jgi:hypothetical protein